MELFDIIAVFITFSALFGYVNHRFITLPETIGVMLISILMSLEWQYGDIPDSPVSGLQKSGSLLFNTSTSIRH